MSQSVAAAGKPTSLRVGGVTISSSNPFLDPPPHIKFGKRRNDALPQSQALTARSSVHAGKPDITRRAQRNSSPSRVGGKPGPRDATSRSDAVPDASPYKSPTAKPGASGERKTVDIWYFWPGAAAEKMRAAGQEVKVHDMVLDFHVGLIQLFEKREYQTRCEDSAAYKLGLKLLMIVSGNGPLTREEFLERLCLALSQLDKDEMSLVLDVSNFLKDRGGEKAFTHGGGRQVFTIVKNLIEYSRQAGSERERIKKKIDKQADALVAQLWPQKRHFSLGSTSRPAPQPEPRPVKYF